MRRIISVALLLAMAAATPARGQAGLGPKIQEVYKRTKTAKTEPEFTEIIQLCEQLRGQTKNAERMKYLGQLLSWALNKRGEMYADQAAAAADATQAQALDEQALRDFEASVSNDPTRWRAVHNRGVSMALAGRHGDAEADFSRTIQLNAKYANAWFNRAEIRYETQQYAEALGDYNQMLRLAPNDVGALRGLGMCRLRLGEPQVAVTELSKALRAAPAESAALIRVGRGQAHQALRQWDKAAEDFRQAVTADAQSADAYQAAAWLMSVCPDERFRNGELAVEAAHKAAELEEQRWGQVSVTTLDTLAAAYANGGQADKAAEYAQQALQRRDQLDPQTRQAIEARLKLYQQGRPYRVAAATAGAAVR